MLSTTPPRQSAVLVGIQLPGVTDEEHAADLAELGRLVHTLGYDVATTLSQKRKGLGSAVVLGSGKLRQLAKLTGGSGEVASGAAKKSHKAREKWEASEEAAAEEAAEREALLAGPGIPPSEADDADGEDDEVSAEAEAAGDDDDSDAEADGDEEDEDVPEFDVQPTVVVVDHELTPSQLRNLEKATGALVLDRTGVIVDIFHRHARSREARMQVEIARLNYLAPRLRESTGPSERQAGRGAGDSSVELDRRKIRDRLAELKSALASVQKDADSRRYARRDQLRVAFVGYTNAGKSSLMRALTGSEVLVADQLFATLDTTVRALQPETRPRILVSDTVGFIKKLPHDLVASFRSTLDEANEASLLLFVVDASDPTWEAQREVTREVLGEIGALDVPSLLLFNKIDRLDEKARKALKRAHPKAIQLSAHRPEDVTALRQRLIDFFDATMEETKLVVPYSLQGRLSEIYDNARVVHEAFDENGRTMTVRGLPAAIAKLKQSFSA